MEFKADTLLMFSGGLDSTGAFWHLLKEGKKLHVHHMNLRNVERRAKAEEIAVRDIIHYMGKIGQFAYSESTHEYPCFNNQFIFDSDLTSFIAGTICLATPWIKEVALGMTASDTNPSIDERIKRGNQIFNSFGTGAVKIHPIKHMTKQDIYDMLPKELRELTWTCRTPVYQKPLPCNKCQSCLEMQKLTLS